MPGRITLRFPYLDGTHAPSSYVEPPDEIPYSPIVVRVLRASIYADTERANLIDTVPGPINLLVGHGFTRGGQWTFRDGLPVETALAHLQRAGVRIHGLSVCNPGRHLLPGSRYFYALGVPMVTFVHQGEGFEFQIRPSVEGVVMKLASRLRIRRTPRIRFRS